MEADPIKITLLGETRCFSNFNLSSVCSNTDTEAQVKIHVLASQKIYVFQKFTVS